MSLALTIKNRRFSMIEKHVNQECKKLEKIMIDPKVSCKILNLKKGISVKISLDSGTKVYASEASGMQINLCVDKAVKRLMRLIETDKDVLLQKKHQHHLDNPIMNPFTQDEITSMLQA